MDDDEEKEKLCDALRGTITKVLMGVAEEADKELHKEVTEEEALELAYHTLGSKPTDEVELRLMQRVMPFIEGGLGFLQRFYEKAIEIYDAAQKVDGMSAITKAVYAEMHGQDLDTYRSIMEGQAMNEVEDAIFGHPGRCAYDILTKTDIPPKRLLELIMERKVDINDGDFLAGCSFRLGADEFSVLQKYANLMFAAQVLRIEDSNPIAMLNAKRFTGAVNGIAKMLKDPSLYDTTKARVEAAAPDYAKQEPSPAKD